MTAIRVTSSVRVALYNKREIISLEAPVAVGNGPGLRIVACQSANALSGGGSFSITCKFDDANNPFVRLEDDTWVDISYGVNGVYWHTMRGVIDDVRIEYAAGRGATTRTATLTGRSFQRVFENTMIWFSPLLAENVLGSVLSTATGGKDIIDGPPQDVIKTVLYSIFAQIGNLSGGVRANWHIPPTMPCGTLVGDVASNLASRTVDKVVAYDTSLVDDLRQVNGQVIARQLKTALISASILFTNASVWQLALDSSDNMFCELFTELHPAGGLATLAADPNMSQGLLPSGSQMSVVFRDKPFMLVSPDTSRYTGTQSSYFALPLNIVNRSELSNVTLGRTGVERFNAFSVVLSSVANLYDDPFYAAPLWNVDDMTYHGMRRMDGSSMYFGGYGVAKAAATAAQQSLREAQQGQLRDFYCLNGTFLSGNATFARAHPELRVGNRLRITAPKAADNLECYIETVAHTWRYNQLATNVQFTRGFLGDPQEQLQTLTAEAAKYKKPIIPGKNSTGTF